MTKLVIQSNCDHSLFYPAYPDSSGGDGSEWNQITLINFLTLVGTIIHLTGSNSWLKPFKDCDNNLI